MVILGIYVAGCSVCFFVFGLSYEHVQANFFLRLIFGFG